MRPQSEAEFSRALETHRAEIRLHCYRLMGSLHDAEDMTQETLLRAWRNRSRFAGRSSIRHWLYRIATNGCLNLLAKRKNRHRLLPDAVGPATRKMPAGEPAEEIPWLEPHPDFLLETAPDAAPPPNARYEQRESIRLAFVAAIQRLGSKQRAVLLLRDVLGWSASETAQCLGLSIASANSALQRARTAMAAHHEHGGPKSSPAIERAEQAVVDRYVRAWESADFDGVVNLLREDARLVMPPWRQWYRGRPAIRSFFGWAFDWAWRTPRRRTFHLVQTSANGQAALATYVRARGESKFHAHALQLLTIRDGSIAALTLFVGPRFFAVFNLPRDL
ncbi:MAG: RNA polymerase subunit sigma-70 [Nibricoccus sp.]